MVEVEGINRNPLRSKVLEGAEREDPPHCCEAGNDVRLCESQVRTPSLNQRLENATERLISRHNTCEQNMLETLKLLETFGDEEQ
ncbi:hypothetical protein ANCDUO_03380 [Ancylostoma duodenale]|uniref:Uncharacterized protein n=1 Tax=Ancylostoma duodenale TaxID=51022 RepID=A0A0C2D976_9BILA|nr:hypothetical protein ANCDUO_03380 [Ancylostoma duodenale]